MFLTGDTLFSHQTYISAVNIRYLLPSFCLLSQGLSVKPRTCQSTNLDMQPAPCLSLPDVWVTCPALKWTLGFSTQVFMLTWQAISPVLKVIFVSFIFNFIYYYNLFWLCLLVFCAGDGTQGLIHAKHTFCLGFIPLPPTWLNIT